MIREFDLPEQNRVILFGGIKGLIRDGDELRNLLLREEPEEILIGISPEELTGLQEFVKEPFEMGLSEYEMMYGVLLSIYGEVMTPPPIYTEAVIYAGERNTAIYALDIEETEFGDIYTNQIGVWDMIRHSVRKRRLMKKEFRADTPEGFVDKWNQYIERIKGFRAIEQARLESMQKNLLSRVRSSGDRKFVVVVEYEKFSGMADFLNSRA
ncbi:MAG: hypothetical protein M1533_01960 [Candidatus Thermoplasmatota archaeon]|jgi:hypothetical protein|nr:hypothetical protein [Candidatus Thermoplasmatota archaeon]MCL5793879.1 hypothetical protein [Candidatus Thermoplasmatota archaeon]